LKIKSDSCASIVTTIHLKTGVERLPVTSHHEIATASKYFAVLGLRYLGDVMGRVEMAVITENVNTVSRNKLFLYKVFVNPSVSSLVYIHSPWAKFLECGMGLVVPERHLTL
jgi:hypothetical protein